MLDGSQTADNFGRPTAIEESEKPHWRRHATHCKSNSYAAARKNADLRTREHLTADEVERVIKAAKDNRHGHRDLLDGSLDLPPRVARRRNLRSALGTGDFKAATLHVRRVKSGTPATHPLTGREMRALRRQQHECPPSPFVFVSERGAPLTAPGFSRIVERAAVATSLGIKAHAHMLRHACGYKLANDGVDTRSLQAYLGHRNIQNTTRYTALAPDRFKGFWKD